MNSNDKTAAELIECWLKVEAEREEKLIIARFIDTLFGMGLAADEDRLCIHNIS